MKPFGEILAEKRSPFFGNLATIDLAIDSAFCEDSALASLRVIVE